MPDSAQNEGLNTKYMKRIVLFLLIAFSYTLCTTSWAAGKDKDTRKFLDATAAHLNKCGGISLQFTVSTLFDKSVQDSTNGTMDVQGKKFQMHTPEMLTWFDGRTQWTKQMGDNEVTMTEPTGTELQAINPYAFIDIYKQGFNYKMKQGTLTNGKEGKKIYLTADNGKMEIREMYLEIDNQHNPIRISIRQGKNQWVRIVVNSFKTGQKFDPAHFTFPKDNYPNAEIIDLR